jgi:hypothetical protein
MSREFRIRREVELPASAQQVFDACTTGTANWLFPTGLEPGVDGGGPLGSTVSWEPPGHFAVRTEGEDGWFNALEYLIETREGGTAVLRYVHSGVITDDWDTQYDGADKHTDFYLHSLGQYLRYFPNRTATYVSVSGPPASSAPDAFERLKWKLGLGDTSKEGASVRVTAPGLTAKDLVVDYLRPQFVGLRSDDALYRFYGRNFFGGTVDAAHHLFAGDANHDDTEQAWNTWLQSVFA